LYEQYFPLFSSKSNASLIAQKPLYNNIPAQEGWSYSSTNSSV